MPTVDEHDITTAPPATRRRVRRATAWQICGWAAFVLMGTVNLCTDILSSEPQQVSTAFRVANILLLLSGLYFLADGIRAAPKDNDA